MRAGFADAPGKITIDFLITEALPAVLVTPLGEGSNQLTRTKLKRTLANQPASRKRLLSFQLNRFSCSIRRMFKPRAAVPSNFNQRFVHAASMILALGGAYGAAAQSSGQNVPNAMQGFSQNRDQPVQIQAASLEMRDKKKEATFSGDVKVVQGDTTMTSGTLLVFYGSSSQSPPAAPPANSKGAAKSAPLLRAATPGPGGSSSIKKLEASGNVVVTQKDQVVTGQTAVFDTRTNLITMLGGVVLTQCQNVLRGDRLLVDMTTGVSRVESDSGKVQGQFSRASGSGCDASSARPGSSTGSRRSRNK